MTDLDKSRFVNEIDFALRRQNARASAGDLATDLAPLVESLIAGRRDTPGPIPMRIVCPDCGELHIDEGEFATKPHHTHECQKCGAVWRPALVPTVGVRFLFKTMTKAGA